LARDRLLITILLDTGLRGSELAGAWPSSSPTTDRGFVLPPEIQELA
jgi:hypothetical protein